MNDTDRNLRQQLRKESDEILFSPMELSDQAKRKIRQLAVTEKVGRRFVFRKKTWIMGAAGLAAAFMIIAWLPMLQQPTVQAPAASPIESSVPSNAGNAGTTGSELSQLITTRLNTAEEAKAAFGPGLNAPTYLPEGYKLSDITAVGMKGEPARDVNFTYVSGEKTITFVASRMPAAFPEDLFSPTQVNGVDGLVFEQTNLTELFWVQSDIQYSVTGNVSADAALKIAESLEG
ncbi:DUF4367 domain-containing protein [Cohnella lupini]|uniref:Uncharacterized protein DUF4367 n=1 Tax=Cohnella lupini TaxID=1294267 RepID=A0A3D9I173_9BACL|nr:DUF4367 domain-containing protein [Cohnella lupini]RED55493.1 uncharacterized protein DUF4367 [Cohnella lupini]